MSRPRKTLITINGQEAERFYRDSAPSFNARRAESIVVVVFDTEGRILGVKKGRSFDLIWCKQDWDDDTAQDAAHREAREQAGVILGDVALAAIIETRLVKAKALRIFTPLITGIVKEIDADFPALAKKRCFLDKETFLKRYRFGEPEDMRVLIETAESYRNKMKLTGRRSTKHK